MGNKFYPATQVPARTFDDKIMVIYFSSTDECMGIFAITDSIDVRSFCDYWRRLECFEKPPYIGIWVFEGEIVWNGESPSVCQGEWRRPTLPELNWLGRADGEDMSPPKQWVEY